MIKILKNCKKSEILSRKIDDYGEYEAVVKDILKEVSERGDAALKEYCAKFDGFTGGELEVSEQEFAEAEAALSEDFKAVVRASAANIALFHKRQVKEG